MHFAKKAISEIKLAFAVFQSKLFFARLHKGDWVYSYNRAIGDKFTRSATLGRISVLATISGDPRALIDPERIDSYMMKVVVIYGGRVISTTYHTTGRVELLNPVKVQTFNRAFDAVCNDVLNEHRRVI